LTSAGTGTDALALITTAADIDVDSADNITIDAADNFAIATAGGTVGVAATGGDLTIDATDKSVIVRGSEAAADAILIEVDDAAGGIDINAGTGNIDIDITTGDFLVDCDLISIDGTGTSNITCTNGAAEDFTIATAGAADHSLIISTTGTGADSLQITTTAGGMDVTNGGASGEDLDIDGVLSAVTINSDEVTVDAIDISASGGGITHTSAAVASTWTHTADGAGDDLSFIVAGAADGSIVLTSSGTGANAIDINTSAGGIDIDMAGGAAGEDFSITTATSVTVTTSEAVADQFKVDATGAVAGDAINFETTQGGIMLNADHATAGDIELNAADDIILTSVGAVTITNTEELTVSGATTLTGAVTCTAGVQMGAVSRQATADGTGTGTIATGTSFVTAVDPTQATDWMTLPSPVAGTIIWIGTVDDAAGFEVRTSDPATIALNGNVGAGLESAIPATASLLRFVCISSNDWIGTMFDADGDEAKIPAPD